tara:strand:- start:35092 stop:35568 length:477 start_codon:yes stop_codon:yes gene_type:complete
MNLTIDMDNASCCKDIPDENAIHQWVTAALSGYKDTVELSIRVVNEDESAELNQRYRSKHGPTNVLSFPADLPESLQLPLLGDLVICAPVVEREAQQQHKSPKAHWAHMLVHGSLHLIGYDHINDEDAENMERLETKILTGLNFPPPYEQLPREIDPQ